VLKDPSNLTYQQLSVLKEIPKYTSVLCRSWQLTAGLRDHFRLANPADAPAHPEWWLRWASRSRIPTFVKFAMTVRKDRERIWRRSN